MDEHLNSDPYESLKPNKYALEYLAFQEHIVTPLMQKRRIRVWHYTRITDDEAALMQTKLEPASLLGLQRRLHKLIQKGLLTEHEAQIIYEDSPYHEQEDIRCRMVCTVDIPLPSNYDGVEPLLESWGGESAYFHLSDEDVGAKLKTIGIPRIVEIETPLDEGLNAYTVAETIIQSWARQLGEVVQPTAHDLFIKDCVDEARVLRVLTKGDSDFEDVGRLYPVPCSELLGE